MKKISILLAIVLIAAVYSCNNRGTSKTESDKNKNQTDTTASISEIEEPDTDEGGLSAILDTIKPENIHIIKYLGNLGASDVILEFHSPSKKDSYSLYMLKGFNTPITVKLDKSVDYIKFNEMNETKGQLSFEKHKKCDFILEGIYINKEIINAPYNVRLQAVEIITENSEGDFDVLQAYSTKDHFYKIHVGKYINNYYIENSSMVAYDKKSGKELDEQVMSTINKADYDVPISCIQPSNTNNPNDIQISFTPFTGNDNRYSTHTAYTFKNGEYQEDYLINNIYSTYADVYVGYNKNGDIYVEESDTRFPHSYIMPVTSGIEAYYDSYTNYPEDKSVKTVYDKADKCFVQTLKQGTYKTVTKIDRETGTVISYNVTTNYPKSDYEISKDGKTLLKCKMDFQTFDMNGQDDLRQVEKIAANAFDVDEERDYEDPMSPFTIILNKNFETIPEAIKKYPNLAAVTELAPVFAKPQTDSTIDIYKYFSKEQIRENMDIALQIMKEEPIKEYWRYQILYEKILKHDNFTISLSKFEDKWGKADSIRTSRDKEKKILYYPNFTLTAKELNGEDNACLVYSLETDTPGFGFGGLYVGVPECNKNFVNNLFKSIGKYKFINRAGYEEWIISLEMRSLTILKIVFNHDNTVKYLHYSSTNSVG